MKKILISGGGGELAQEICRQNSHFDIVSVSKKEMNTCSYKEVADQLTTHSPDIFLHAGALTHPMELHADSPIKSIKNNILGTATAAMCCAATDTKMVYISTDWVYPNRRYNTEEDALLPFTNYGWSKLGGECAVQMIPNHLILRCSFTARPYKFKKAFADVYKSYLYLDEGAFLILKLLEKNCKGIYNICGKTRTAYAFARESFPDVGKVSKDESCTWYPSNCTMSDKKLSLFLNNARD